jgi:hypothetical protein
MRKLILFLMLAVPLFAQGPHKVALNPPPRYATVLDGSTQWWSKTTPVGMDLNGAEMITASTTFEVDSTGWSKAAFNDFRTTNARAHSGSKSLAGIATAAVSFPYLRLTTAIANTSTNKFTFEVWAYVPATNVQDTVVIQVVNQGFSSSSFGVAVTTTKLTKGTWSKLVLNVQASGTQTGILFYAQLAGLTGIVDTLYIDDVSLTQAKDAMVMGIINATAGTVIFCASTGDGNNPRYNILGTTGTLRTYLHDGTTASDGQNGTLVDGKDHSYQVTINRTGNVTRYIDGVSVGTTAMTALGKITVTNLSLGYLSAGYLTGKLGQTQTILYDALPADIASTIAYIGATYKTRGLPKVYPGGTIVLDVDWSQGGLDKSGQGNHLSNTGGAPTMRVKY